MKQSLYMLDLRVTEEHVVVAACSGLFTGILLVDRMEFCVKGKFL